MRIFTNVIFAIVGILLLSTSSALAQRSWGDLISKAAGGEEETPQQGSQQVPGVGDLLGQAKKIAASPSPLKRLARRKGKGYKIKGVLTGAAVGAAGGVLATESAEGAIAGAVVGGLAGYGIGQELDKRWEHSVANDEGFKADTKVYSEALVVRKKELEKDTKNLKESQQKTQLILAKERIEGKKIKGLKRQIKLAQKQLDRAEEEIRIDQEGVVSGERIIAKIRSDMASEAAKDDVVKNQLRKQLKTAQLDQQSFIELERKAQARKVLAQNDLASLKTFSAG